MSQQAEFGKTKFRIKGDVPLLHHSRRLANWRDPITKELKLITSKRKKSEEEFQAISHLEFLGGLYLSANGKHPIVPTANLEASITKAAARQKLGRACKQGLLVEKDMDLEYDGPKTAEELWNDDRFVFVTQVVITGTTDRTRPIFPEWGGEFVVIYNRALLNDSQVVRAVEDAGAYEGVGDWRPKYGRFSVVSHETIQ